MPNEKKRLTERDELTPEELEAQNEKFRTFFSTSVAQVPEEMNRRDEEEAEQHHGLFARLFRRDKTDPKPQPSVSKEMPTGEIVLGGCEVLEEETADLELALDPERSEPAPAAPKPAPRPAAPAPEKKEEPKQCAAVPKPEQMPARPASAPEKRSAPRREPQKPLSPQERREAQELRELKDMLDVISGIRPAAPKPQPAPAAVVPEERPAPPEPLEPEKPQPPERETPQPPTQSIPLYFAAEGRTELPSRRQEPEVPVVHERPDAFRLFGTPEDEAGSASRKSDDEDTMSIPLLPLEEEPAPEAPAAQPASHAQPEPVQPEPEETGPETPEQVLDHLRQMSASLTLRCVLSALLTVVLLGLGLTAEGLLPPTLLDPVAAPTSFYGANLLLLVAAAAVAYPVLRDGLAGLRGRPSAETMPALAAVGALLQAAAALLTAESYQAASWTLLSGIAALGLSTALLGTRIQLAAVRGGVELIASGVEHQGAYRVRDKDLIRSLAQGMDQQDPWVLLSRPMEWDAGLVEQCFGEHAGERRAHKAALILLGMALLSGLVFLLFGAGIGGAAAAMTAVLCMGAPLSSTLIVGLASLRLQRAAAAVGAIVPGWSAVEELGGVDTIQVSAEELFTPDSAMLEDIRIFKGGRIDRAILYSASVLNQSCPTLRSLFRQIIEDRTDILFPVRDLETHYGLGFSAWCDNNHILIGTREYMKQQDVPVPELEYENEHSKQGQLQVLYLAVSGNLYAMFVLRYVGGRNAARSLTVLQKENIRLLVSCQDPSLTAWHIAEAYHLPDGMVTLLGQEQCGLLAARPREAAPCCMVHLKGLASLTGGLSAAEQAQNAETTATTVQLVSVWFSVAIAALLTYAGSIGGLSVAAVLMYQAAWSALSIAVCALKQH